MCKDAETTAELRALVTARYPLIYVVAAEERHAEAALAAVAKARYMDILYWGVSRGFVDREGEVKDATTDPIAALQYIHGTETSCLYVLRDYDAFLDDAVVRRWLRDLATDLPRGERSRTVVILSPTLKIPPALERTITVVDWPLPGKAQLGQILNTVVSEAATAVLSSNQRAALFSEPEDRIVEAAIGLTADEAENIIAKTLASNGKLTVDPILAAKRDAIRKSGVLEYIPYTGGFEDVAGLESLKEYAARRRKAFGEEARAFGLSAPRGVLFVGPPGTGKSLVAKTLGSVWKLPLVRFDVGRLLGSLVGESEANGRAALKLCEAVAPCIVHFDEIEKGLAGTGTDTSGVTTRLVGMLLTWMQERTAPCYVVATCNDATALRPELIRRFDATFVLDLPHAAEREACFAVHLRKRGRQPEAFDLASLASVSDGFSGAEVEKAIEEALTQAFDAGRELTTDDIHCAIKGTYPLSATCAEQLAAMRDWAKGRAIPASKPPVPEAKAKGRRILVDLSQKGGN